MQNTGPKKFKIYVNYFVQNDPWESISEPNLFVLPGEYTNINDVKAEAVYEYLPLKAYNNFYLRFFLDDKVQSIKVWMDYPPSATIPVYNGQVFVKVLRLPKGVKVSFRNNEIFERKARERSPAEPHPTEKPVQAPVQAKSPEPRPVQIPNSSPTKVNRPKEEQLGAKILIKQEEKESMTEKNILKENPSGNLLDFSNIISSTNSENSNKNSPNVNQAIDFEFVSDKPDENKKMDNKWDFLSGGVAKNNQNNSNQYGKSDLHINLEGVFSGSVPSGQTGPPIIDLSGIKSFQDTTTIPNSKGKEIDKIPANLNESELTDLIDKVILKWAKGVNEKKNLLYLLSTLHEVWTCDPSWKEVSMQELVNDKKLVRKTYKTAMGQLHADKNKDKDFKTQYIAGSLYHLISEANSSFS